jgi:carotenoid cleavage dioxygenase
MKEIKETLLLLLGFMPWILFLFLAGHSLASLEKAIIICFLASILLGFNELRNGFMLQWGTFLFFTFCFVSLNHLKITWVATHMSMLANGTLASIMWISVLLGRPFALQYARKNLPKERWNDQNLFRSCQFITMIWGALMLLAVAISLFKTTHPAFYPQWVYFDASISIIVSGITFTIIYKHYKRKRSNVPSFSKTL